MSKETFIQTLINESFATELEARAYTFELEPNSNIWGYHNPINQNMAKSKNDNSLILKLYDSSKDEYWSNLVTLLQPLGV